MPQLGTGISNALASVLYEISPTTGTATRVENANQFGLTGLSGIALGTGLAGLNDVLYMVEGRSDALYTMGSGRRVASGAYRAMTVSDVRQWVFLDFAFKSDLEKSDQENADLCNFSITPNAVPRAELQRSFQVSYQALITSITPNGRFGKQVWF